MSTPRVKNTDKTTKNTESKIEENNNFVSSLKPIVSATGIPSLIGSQDITKNKILDQLVNLGNGVISKTINGLQISGGTTKMGFLNSYGDMTVITGFKPKTIVLLSPSGSGIYDETMTSFTNNQYCYSSDNGINYLEGRIGYSVGTAGRPQWQITNTNNTGFIINCASTFNIPVIYIAQ